MIHSEPKDLSSTVLIVDDEPAILKMLAMVLESQGMTAHTVETGEAAIERLSAQSFGCMLVDKNLPGIDGLKVIKYAREVQPFCACIVITAHASERSAIDALRLGAFDYLEKPFSEIELIAEKVHKAITHQRVLFERAQLQERVNLYHTELGEKGSQVERQETQLEMLEKVLTARVRMAVRHVTSSHATGLGALLGQLQTIDLSACDAATRAVLERATTQLDASVRALGEGAPLPIDGTEET